VLSQACLPYCSKMRWLNVGPSLHRCNQVTRENQRWWASLP
jgi:hypothetical protein